MLMGIDHSLTYREFKLRNIPHLIRLRTLKRLVTENSVDEIDFYADFGCSNGYLTNIFAEISSPKKSFGFDLSDNIKEAKIKFPYIDFDYIDLNGDFNFSKKFDLITCFETLEHVGNIRNALEILKKAANNNSYILISVPIEIGTIGLLKYLVKRFLLKYELPLLCNDFEYLHALITQSDISKYRKISDGYGSHFGFDYRYLDTEINKAFSSWKVDKFNSGSTRFYRITIAS